MTNSISNNEGFRKIIHKIRYILTASANKNTLMKKYVINQ